MQSTGTAETRHAWRATRYIQGVSKSVANDAFASKIKIEERLIQPQEKRQQMLRGK